MRRHVMAVILGLGVLGFGASAFQEQATLILKSGTRVSGQLVDLNASGFTIRVRGDERQIPKNDVAVIDFGSGGIRRPSELNDLRGQHLAVLRGGGVVLGEFIDIGGTHPLRLTFATASGERNLSSADVARIYLARLADEEEEGVKDTIPSTPWTNRTGRIVTVSARQQWTATGVTVTRGQRMEFETRGRIQVDPSGLMAGSGGVTGRSDAGTPVEGAPLGALIARVGGVTGWTARASGAAGAFLIGTQDSVVMPNGGQLFLGVNDRGLDDNQGSFEVKLIGIRER